MSKVLIVVDSPVEQTETFVGVASTVKAMKDAIALDTPTSVAMQGVTSGELENTLDLRRLATTGRSLQNQDNDWTEDSYLVSFNARCPRRTFDRSANP